MWIFLIKHLLPQDKDAAWAFVNTLTKTTPPNIPCLWCQGERKFCIKTKIPTRCYRIETFIPPFLSYNCQNISAVLSQARLTSSIKKRYQVSLMGPWTKTQARLPGRQCNQKHYHMGEVGCSFWPSHLGPMDEFEKCRQSVWRWKSLSLENPRHRERALKYWRWESLIAIRGSPLPPIRWITLTNKGTHSTLFVPQTGGSWSFQLHCCCWFFLMWLC